MYSRSLFIRLDKLNIQTINDAIRIQEYFESFICYITKKIITDTGYPDMDVRYNYASVKIDNAFNTVEYITVLSNLQNFLLGLNHVLTKNIEETVYEFYMSTYSQNGCLNLNSMLINCNSLLITYEFFQNREN